MKCAEPNVCRQRYPVLGETRCVHQDSRAQSSSSSSNKEDDENMFLGSKRDSSAFLVWTDCYHSVHLEEDDHSSASPLQIFEVEIEQLIEKN